MSRPVTLFTGQWADLPLEKVCQKAKSFGYDGLELACWGDHFEISTESQDYRSFSNHFLVEVKRSQLSLLCLVSGNYNTVNLNISRC